MTTEEKEKLLLLELDERAKEEEIQYSNNELTQKKRGKVSLEENPR